MQTKQATQHSIQAFAPVGGGMLWASVCFDVTYSCIDCFLGCFNNK